MTVPDFLGHPDAAHLPPPSAPPGALPPGIADLDFIDESIPDAGDGLAQAKEEQRIVRLVAGRDGLVQVKMAHALGDKHRHFYKRCVVKAPKRAASKEASR